MVSFASLLDGMKRPASRTDYFDGHEGFTRITYDMILKLNKEIEPGIRENDIEREIGSAAAQSFLVGGQM